MEDVPIDAQSQNDFTFYRLDGLEFHEFSTLCGFSIPLFRQSPPLERIYDARYPH
jgi:hypothetical protein